MKKQELRDFLNRKAEQYQHPDFLKDDPISIPHVFNKKEDIEISGFLTAIISWGNRKSIINSARRLMDMMGWDPYEYVMAYRPGDLSHSEPFVHRTFNREDLKYFIQALQHLYFKYGGLQPIFKRYAANDHLQGAISAFKRHFFELEHPVRSTKHLSDPAKGSAAKRLNMFLRWMVRTDAAGVDFGIWDTLNPAQLSCPLDVHSGRVARKLGLLKRRQNDARAVLELDTQLRLLDPEDPVKYDFALFGLGVFEKF